MIPTENSPLTRNRTRYIYSEKMPDNGYSATSVTRLGDLMAFWQLFKACGENVLDHFIMKSPLAVLGQIIEDIRRRFTQNYSSGHLISQPTTEVCLLVLASVTRWLDYLFNIGPLAPIKICLVAYNICQCFNILPNTKATLKMAKGFTISPNLVTLVLVPNNRQFEIKK